MAFLTTNEIKQQGNNWIHPFDDVNVEGANYELRLGEQYFLTDSRNGKREILNGKHEQVEIRPGQFALLLTQEKVSIRTDMIAFISVKAGIKLKGLVNVSGFHVDPGFEGRLIFSVYNAGPRSIILDHGSKCFMIWFAKLSTSADAHKGTHKDQNGIKSKYIEALKGNLASPNVLLDRIKSNENKLTNVLWALTLLIGLGITLTVKALYDEHRFNEGYKAGVISNSVNEEIEAAEIKKLISSKVDSVLKAKGVEVKNSKE